MHDDTRRRGDNDLLPERRRFVVLTVAAVLVAGQLPAAEPPKELTNSIGMKFVLIPAGEFTMGSPGNEKERLADEGPRHRVRITRPFYLGRCEVSQGAYEAVTDSCPWNGKPYVKVGSEYAASYVSWDDAVEFCRLLSEREDKKYRLPTEAEWEYACRAGTQTAYHFGNEASRLDDYAWFDSNAYNVGNRYAHEVGQKKANAFGLYDMHGNVWEWCTDRYAKDYYAMSLFKDPVGSATGVSRVARGGSWIHYPWYCRSAFRFRRLPDYRVAHFGFRVVLNVSGGSSQQASERK